MALRYKGRLPGVVVEQAPQQIPNTLRMDVPGLVGFAERGPLDTPIMVEDIQQYRAVFGGDVFLAHDQGVPIYAQLPRAVQAFFDNGGRRCYVVRVAGNNARPNRFRIPALIQRDADGNMYSVERPAAWVGRWSDAVNIATRLRRRPLRLYREWKDDTFVYHQITISDEPAQPAEITNAEGANVATKPDASANKPVIMKTVELSVQLPNADTVRKGDLLAIHLNDKSQTQIFTRIITTEQLGYGSYESAAWQGIPVRLKAATDTTTAFSFNFNLPPLAQVSTVEYGYVNREFGETIDDVTESVVWYALPRPRFADFEANIAQGDFYNLEFTLIDNPDAESGKAHHNHWCLCDKKNPKVIFTLPPTNQQIELPDGSLIDRDQSGDIVRLEFENGLVIEFRVKSATPEVHGDHTPPHKHLSITSDGFNFALDALTRIDILGNSGWEELPKRPSSSLIYTPASRTQPYQLRYRMVRQLKRLIVPNDLLRLTFAQEHVFYFPVTSFDWQYLPDGTPELILTAPQLLMEAEPLRLDVNDVHHVDLLGFDLHVREGNNQLENWAARSFGPTEIYYWENVLARVAQDDSVRTAKDIVDSGRSIRLGLLPDEPTPEAIPFFVPLNMLERQPQPIDFEGALPDDRFARGTKDGLDSFDPVELFLDKDFYREEPQERLIPREIAELANQKLFFLDPTKSRIEQKPKKLQSLYEIDDVSLIAIPDLAVRCWQKPPAKRIVMPAKTDDDCNDGKFHPCPPPAPERILRRDLPFMKEREEQAALLRQGDIQASLYWNLEKLPVLVPLTDDCGCDTSQILVVQRALVNMCVARTDIVAILSLPQHFKLHDTLDWHQQIVCPRDENRWNPDDVAVLYTCPRDALDEDALGFAAVYHGWTTVREELTPELNSLRLIVPDGTMLGLIAARTLERGVGIAPANQTMQGIVGLEPEITDAEWEILFDRQINVLRQRVQRFTVLSIHTLSHKRLVVKLSIKRLTIYIRKLILREGHNYVFEANTPRFRQSVQAMFERVMARLLQQGALVGYRVDAGEGLNPPQDVDAGRFTIEIQYAPTHPVEYITIVLMRTSESLLEVVER